MGVLKFIVNEILSQPVYLMGTMALVGLLVLKKSFSEILSGTLKTIVGFLIFTAGANLVVTTLSPLGTLVQAIFHLHGVVPTNEAIVLVALKSFGRQVSLIMALGFVMNLIFARVTPAKYVFLSGHLLLYFAAVLAATMGAAGIAGIHGVILGAVLLGTMATAMPALLQPLTNKVTHGAAFAVGHCNTLGFLAAALVGKLVGRGSRSAEETKISDRHSFLKEPVVTTSIAMVFLYILLAAVAGPAVLQQYTGGSNHIMYAVREGLTFGASIAIIMYGIQMMLEEIVPAFKGIAAKVIPDAMPALDCPTVFPYAPTSMLIGFIASLIGGIAGMFLMGPLGLVLIIPGMVAQFFDGGAAGVYGNATGGRRGAILGSFVNGLLITILPALLLPYMGSLGKTSMTFADTDFCWVGIVSGLIARMGVAGAYAGVILFAGVLLGLAGCITVRFRKAGVATA